MILLVLVMIVEIPIIYWAEGMDLRIHCTRRGPTLVKPHSLVELVGSLVLISFKHIFIHLHIGTITTEHTNIKNTNNNDEQIKPPSSQNFSRASLNTEKPHSFACSNRSSASFGEGHAFHK